MSLMMVAHAANGAKGGPSLACVVEHPEDVEREGSSGLDVSGSKKANSGMCLLVGYS